MTFSPELDLPRLKRLCTVVDMWALQHGDAIRRPEPSVSAWSAEQHLAHLTLANELVVRNLKSLAKESGALVVREAAQSAIALDLLASGRLPRGQAQSPRMVRPPEVIDRNLMLLWIAELLCELDDLDPSTLPHGRVFVPHQILGPLDGPQWLRFAVVHTRHHMVIAREALAAGGVKTPELEAI